MKLLIEVWMDGYDSAEEMRSAIIEHFDEMDTTATCFNVLWAEDAKDIQW